MNSGPGFAMLVLHNEMPSKSKECRISCYTRISEPGFAIFCSTIYYSTYIIEGGGVRILLIGEMRREEAFSKDEEVTGGDSTIVVCRRQKKMDK